MIARRAVWLGSSTTVGIIHDGHGQLRALAPRERRVYAGMKRLGKHSYAKINYFQDNIAAGRPNRWRCRAGARYLYIREDGLVHYCSRQRGHPAIPLERYTIHDIRREYLMEKTRAPWCTVACAQQVSYADFWRTPQTIRPMPAAEPGLVRIETASR